MTFTYTPAQRAADTKTLSGSSFIAARKAAATRAYRATPAYRAAQTKRASGADLRAARKAAATRLAA